jgi:hypothetical protein
MSDAAKVPAGWWSADPPVTPPADPKIIVHGPNGVSVNFPAGTDSGTINGVMAQHLGGGQSAPSGPWDNYAPTVAAPVAPPRPMSDPWADFRSAPPTAPAPAGWWHADPPAPAAPEFGSDPYVNALAQKHGADPEMVRGLVNSQAATEGVKGIPILGGLTDKAGAGISALAAPLTGAGVPGSSLGERYGKNLALEQEIAADFEREHPNVAMAANVAGGLTATAPLAATGAGARLLGLTAKTLPTEIGAGAASGAVINGADAAVRGNDPVSAALIGGGLGLAAPLAGAVARPVINTVRGIVDPAGEAARRVAGAVGRDVTAGTGGLSPQEFQAAQASGQPVNAMDLGGETTRALARSAANTSPEGRAILDRSINDRFESQTGRMTDWLRSTFNYPDAAAQQAAIEQAQKATNKVAYPAAQAAADVRYPQGIWSPELERLTSSPDVVDAMRESAQRGAGRAVAEGYGGFNPGVTFDNGMVNFRRSPTGVPTYPDMRFWDYSYRNLRDSADQAFRAGRNSEGNSLKTQANQLRTELDQMVPEFTQARAGASHFFGASDALEAGQNFVTSRLDNGAARQALAKMSPNERQLFQDGYVDRVVKGLQEQSSRRSLLNDPAMLNSPAAIERRQIALGPQRANELETMLHTERLMDLARSAVQGNSTTARQLAELGIAGGVSTISGGGNPLDPQALVHGALVYGALRGRGAINERVSQQVARFLTSQNPNNVRFGMQMASRGPALNALRNTSAALARVAGPQVSGGPAAPMMPAKAAAPSPQQQASAQ